VLAVKPVEDFKTDERLTIRASAARRVAFWRHSGRTLLTEELHQQNNANQNKDKLVQKTIAQNLKITWCIERIPVLRNLIMLPARLNAHKDKLAALQLIWQRP
jgi:hypothetical protein